MKFRSTLTMVIATASIALTGPALAQQQASMEVPEIAAEDVTSGQIASFVNAMIALERILTLTVTGARVRLQARKLDAPGNNPLGRVLKVYHDNPQADVETLELKLSEAILRETPKINRMLMFLKIIAVVAPLLGLLGTVTGMIITFQAITLFGTGDPKLMAGGISQALVTTVLGLCVAIPTVLLHTVVTSRARRLNQVLEEQAAGMVAAQSEAQHAKAA